MKEKKKKSDNEKLLKYIALSHPSSDTIIHVTGSSGNTTHLWQNERVYKGRQQLVTCGLCA
jgi:hypothetical protein